MFISGRTSRMASTEYQNLDPLMFSRRQKRKSDSLDQMIMLQESRKRVFQVKSQNIFFTEQFSFDLIM